MYDPPPEGSCIFFFAQGPMESEIVYVRERQKKRALATSAGATKNFREGRLENILRDQMGSARHPRVSYRNVDARHTHNFL